MKCVLLKDEIGLSPVEGGTLLVRYSGCFSIDLSFYNLCVSLSVQTVLLGIGLVGQI